jgi:hypothetical protein
MSLKASINIVWHRWPANRLRAEVDQRELAS